MPVLVVGIIIAFFFIFRYSFTVQKLIPMVLQLKEILNDAIAKHDMVSSLTCLQPFRFLCPHPLEERGLARPSLCGPSKANVCVSHNS